MNSANSSTKSWNKPSLEKLGTLKDVAGSGTVGNDQGPQTKNKS
jgi:hypothetical protein